jgi:hypothetical protein
MPRFEQRITESEVSAAREAMAAGESLRSAAAKIPCAPSTLSARLKRARAQHAANDTNGRGEHHASQTAVQPLEILRSALLATKSNGEPHWPTRLGAIRTLATLCPEEFASKAGEEDDSPGEPSIVVFDLEPGAVPVLHRPRKEDERAADEPAAASEGAPETLTETSAMFHNFSLETVDGEWLPIGTWSAPRPKGATTVTVTGAFHTTDSAEEAERWRSELSAGALPTGIEDDPA